MSNLVTSTLRESLRISVMRKAGHHPAAERLPDYGSFVGLWRAFQRLNIRFRFLRRGRSQMSLTVCLRSRSGTPQLYISTRCGGLPLQEKSPPDPAAEDAVWSSRETRLRREDSARSAAREFARREASSRLWAEGIYGARMCTIPTQSTSPGRHPVSCRETLPRTPCKTRFRMAGCAFAGRESNPLDATRGFRSSRIPAIEGLR